MTRPIATLSLVMFAAHFAIPPAAAQYPTKPIHLIVPAAPGGGTDIAARSFVPALQDNLGQPVVRLPSSSKSWNPNKAHLSDST